MRTILYSNIFEGFSPFVEFCAHTPIWVNNPVLDEKISKTPFEYQLTFETDGIRKKDLQIKVENDQLLISGYRKESDKGWFKKERSVVEHAFNKRIAITDDMDTDAIKATFKNGKLTISIPKKKAFVNYREIPVSGDDFVEDAEVLKADNPGFINSMKEKIHSIFK